MQQALRSTFPKLSFRNGVSIQSLEYVLPNGFKDFAVSCMALNTLIKRI